MLKVAINMTMSGAHISRFDCECGTILQGYVSASSGLNVKGELVYHRYLLYRYIVGWRTMLSHIWWSPNRKTTKRKIQTIIQYYIRCKYKTTKQMRKYAVMLSPRNWEYKVHIWHMAMAFMTQKTRKNKWIRGFRTRLALKDAFACNCNTTFP